jgi:hypothetical protein
MHRSIALRAAVAVCLTLFSAALASAAPQTQAQQTCINALNDAGEKVTKALAKELARCVSAAARGKLPPGQTADDCFAADADGRIANARLKTETIAARKCTETPSFGASAPTIVNDAFETLRVAAKLFGASLDGAVIDAESSSVGAACQKAAIKALTHSLVARLDAFNACARKGLASGVIDSAAALELCGAQSLNAGAACDAKGQKLIDEKCTGIVTADAFPGECSGVPLTELMTCLAPRVACDACRNANVANAIDAGCDPYVDGVASPRCSDLPSSGWSAAREWDEALLASIRVDLPRPPVHARNLFHVAVAMYDAWATYDDVADQYLTNETPGPSTDIEADRATAISFAAYRVIKHRFTNAVQAANTLAMLAEKMEDLGYDESFTSTVGDSPAAIGNRIGAAIIAHGLSDGSNEAGNYADPTYTPVNEPLIYKLGEIEMVDPNRWQPLALDFFITQNGIPLPSGIQGYVGSGWGPTLPFALTGPRPYHDPGIPPQINHNSNPDDWQCAGGASEDEYKAAAVEVIRYNSRLSPDDGVTIDISPGARGNNTLGTNDGTGYPVNPVTGQPYAPNVVKRGDFTRIIPQFWADGPKSETPPGHWHLYANYVSDSPLVIKQIGATGPVVNDLEWDVKMYFAISSATHDAAVACWDIKRTYDYVRPISMIRFMGGLGQSSDPGGPSYHTCGLPLEPGLIEVVTAETTAPGERHEALAGDEGEIAIRGWVGQPADITTQTGGVAWILARKFQPFMVKTFVTPPFAAYTSGHSTFSRAAAEVLTAITGDSYFPGGVGEFPVPANTFLQNEKGPSEPITLQWARYYDAADDAGISRPWAGIHVRADDFNGRMIGSQVGLDAWALAQTYFDGTAVP